MLSMFLVAQGYNSLRIKMRVVAWTFATTYKIIKKIV